MLLFHVHSDEIALQPLTSSKVRIEASCFKLTADRLYTLSILLQAAALRVVLALLRVSSSLLS